MKLSQLAVRRGGGVAQRSNECAQNARITGSQPLFTIPHEKQPSVMQQLRASCRQEIPLHRMQWYKAYGSHTLGINAYEKQLESVTKSSSRSCKQSRQSGFKTPNAQKADHIGACKPERANKPNTARNHTGQPMQTSKSYTGCQDNRPQSSTMHPRRYRDFLAQYSQKVQDRLNEIQAGLSNQYVHQKRTIELGDL